MCKHCLTISSQQIMLLYCIKSIKNPWKWGYCINPVKCLDGGADGGVGGGGGRRWGRKVFFQKGGIVYVEPED